MHLVATYPIVLSLPRPLQGFRHLLERRLGIDRRRLQPAVAREPVEHHQVAGLVEEAPREGVPQPVGRDALQLGVIGVLADQLLDGPRGEGRVLPRTACSEEERRSPVLPDRSPLAVGLSFI